MLNNIILTLSSIGIVISTAYLIYLNKQYKTLMKKICKRQRDLEYSYMGVTYDFQNYDENQRYFMKKLKSKRNRIKHK